MSYVDGFLVAVPNENKGEYLDHAKIFAGIFKEYGALKVVEAWGDDVPSGEITSFPMAVKCQEGESVVLSWVVWPSKEMRDAGWQKMMKDPRMAPEKHPMPFDGKRLVYGGFEMILDA